MSTSKEKSQANHAATITGNAAGSVLEDSLSVASGLLVVNDLDNGENQVKAIKEKSGEYGKFSISTDGNWKYVLDNHSTDVQALAEGETVTEKFVVTSKDGSALKTVEVTITGTNDVASIKGDTRATLTEDSPHTTARGELEVKDQDHGQSSVQAVASQAGTYGSFSIDAKGHWTYVMDNSLAATQALAQGEKGTDSFVVWSQDGSASQTVTMTLKGVNDEATITGQDTGSVSEDAASNTATGQLIVNDVDHGENTVVPITTQAGAYGNFSIVADGNWTYTLDNSLLAVQSLPAGVTLTETFVVYSSDSLLLTANDDHDSDNEDGNDEDGHDETSESDHHAPSYKGASKVVTVTIVGTNDAAVISGSSTGAVAEDLSLGVTGQLSVSDIDAGEASFQAQSSTVGSYGNLSIGIDGTWSYVLNNGADNVQALATGETATDTFVVKSYDGTEQQITLTLTGTNDLATISGTSTGAVSEDATLTTGAALAVADVDHGEAVFQAQSAVAATYGSFAISTDGHWTYALNNTATNVQALAAGEQVTDSFTVASFDGTASQLVTATITGTNDGPVVTNNSAAAAGAVAEDGALAASGQLAASDVDHGATQIWSAQGSANGAYGAIGIDATSGQWTYNLDNGAANVQALAAGETHTESFTLRVADDQGATADQQVSVSVIGSNDGPVVSEQDVIGSVQAVAQAGSIPVTTPIQFTVQQYLGHQSNSLADLRGYSSSHTADYTVQTNVIDYTDDPAGFAGELPGSSRWPAAQATGASQTYDYVNNNFFARITADFSVSTADTYTFRTFNDDGVFLLIDNTLVISDTGYHPEYPFTGSIALTPGNHTIELFFYENGGEASLEFSARTSTGSYGLVGSTGGGFSGAASQVTDTGLISFSDVDLTDVHLVSATGTPMGDALGTLSAVKTSDTTGSGVGGEIQWTYTAPNSALVYLAEGQTKVESFTITLNDQHGGVVTKQVDVTLTGTNDVASISGVSTGTVHEDTTLAASGTLTVADQDQGEAQAQAVDALLGNYGSFSVDANGHWTYALNNTATNVQALAAGQTVTDSFTVSSQDGTASQDVTISVAGSNDGPTGSATAALAAGAEDTAYTVSVADLLTGFSDVDNGDVLHVTGVAASNGTLVNNGNGSYTVTPTANFNGAVTLNYNVLDGQGGSVAATQSYNLAAVNDAPVLRGTLTEQLYTSSLSGWTPFLVNNGVWVTPNGASSGDTAPHTFVRQFTAAQDGNYVFQFAVDNEGSVLVDGVAIPGLYNNDWSHSTVQTVALTAGIHTVTMHALNWGGPAAFAMNITDPNHQEIWNTRTHLNPEPLILSYTENQAAIVISSGLTLADIDSPTLSHATVSVATGFAASQDVLGFVDQNGITGSYDAATGVLSLSGFASQAQYQAALRSVTYSNSSDSPSTADRMINFSVDDGAGQFNLSNTVLSQVVVMAVNDVATISGTSSGTVQVGTALSASGSLTVSDADTGEAVFVVQTATAGNHGYGNFSIDAAGAWSYAVTNNQAVIQGLTTSQTLTDSVTVTSFDGTATQDVTVTLVGVNG